MLTSGYTDPLISMVRLDQISEHNFDMKTSCIYSTCLLGKQNPHEDNQGEESQERATEKEQEGERWGAEVTRKEMGRAKYWMERKGY